MRRPSLDAAELSGLAPDLAVEVVESVPSTNAVATERAREGAPEGTVVVAEHQTAGRGRLDRSWEAPPRSSLVFSVLLRPTVPATSWPWLPLLAGHTVAKTLRSRGYAAAAVKWPNDVLLGERKVAGILVERVDTPDVPAAVVADVARQGAELAREHAGPQGPPSSLLNQEVLTVSSPSDAVAVPMRCVMALSAMGFMPGAEGEVVRVRALPGWLRIDARFGSVFRRRGDPLVMLG